MQINCGDWQLLPFFPNAVQTCDQDQVAGIVKFGVVGWNHDGFLDAHPPVLDEAPGRAYIRPNRPGQLVFSWEIAGWEYVQSAEIWIFPYGQNRPVAFEVVRQAQGTIETYGTTAGIRLTDQQRVVIPNDVYTVGGGPYLARISISKVVPNTRVTVGAMRTYFEVLPMVVVGGGFAGIRAAACILERGNNESVLLLEALDRLGGRACTIDWQGFTIDMGCQFFQDSKTNPLVPLARGLGQDVFGHEQKLVFQLEGENIEKDKRWKKAEDVAIWAGSTGQDVSLSQEVASHGADEADPNFLRLALALEADLDEAIEPDQCTKAQEASAEEDSAEEDSAEEDSAEEDSAEVGSAVQGSSQYESKTEEDDDRGSEEMPANMMSSEGYGALLQKYAAKTCAAAGGCLVVKTSCVVSSLELTPKYVRVRTYDGVYCAAGVILSVSTGVIRGKYINFAPELPGQIEQLFEYVPMGHYKKVFLPIKKASELDKYLRKLGTGSRRQEWSVPTQTDLSFFTLDQHLIPWKFLYRLEWCLVVAFVGGEAAECLDGTDDRNAARDALSALSLMLAWDVERVKSCWTGQTISTHWSQEPYFWGAYSYTRPGGVTAKARSILRDAVVNGRIVFAGEAMRIAKDEFATAHGAWWSGEYAADKLLGLGL
jgi:monoamine oxidase